MKYVELKDLNSGDKIICAWHSAEHMWIPVEIIIRKFGPQIELIDYKTNSLFPFLYDTNSFSSINEFFVNKKGKDINKKNIFELGVFDSINEAQKWCNRENEFNKKYSKMPNRHFYTT